MDTPVLILIIYSKKEIDILTIGVHPVNDFGCRFFFLQYNSCNVWSHVFQNSVGDHAGSDFFL